MSMSNLNTGQSFYVQVSDGLNTRQLVRFTNGVVIFYPSEEYLAFEYRTIYVQFSNGVVFKLPLYCYSDLEPNPLLSIAQGKSKSWLTYIGLHLTGLTVGFRW